MAELLWSLVCEKPIVDSQSNQVSIIGIIEQLNVPKTPSIFPQMLYVVSLWGRTSQGDESFKYRIKIVQGTMNYIYGDTEFEAVIPEGKERLRNLIALPALKIEEIAPLSIIFEQLVGTEWKEEKPIKVIVKSLAEFKRI